MKKQGFTIIEFFIVLAIIGILASIFLASIGIKNKTEPVAVPLEKGASIVIPEEKKNPRDEFQVKKIFEKDGVTFYYASRWGYSSFYFAISTNETVKCTMAQY